MTKQRLMRGGLMGMLGLMVAVAAIVPGATAPVTAAPNVDMAHASRRPPMVTAQAATAIENGLRFLARTQDQNGSWRSTASHGSYPVAMTSMAGLAFLSAGNTPHEGPYADNVRRAVTYVLSSADPQTGLIARISEEQRPMYAHGFGMLFLAEVYGMERDPEMQEQIRRVLKRAVALTVRSQSDWGGWLYSPDSSGDEGSVTITQVQGLRACRNAGIEVPKSVIDRSIGYIEKSVNPDGGVRYTARGGGRSLPAITAQAVASLYNAGEYEHPVAEKCLEYLRNLMQGGRTTNVFGGHHSYAIFYASQAMYLSGEENWRFYFPRLRDELINLQQPNGSWRGDSVGETYGTAVAIVCLSLPYRYVPIFQR